MAHPRKYTEASQARTTTFHAADLETLRKHATYGQTVTDLIQTAVKELITNRGWDEDQPDDPDGTRATKPSEPDQRKKDKVTHPEPDKKEEPSEPDDPTEGLPDYLKGKGGRRT